MFLNRDTRKQKMINDSDASILKEIVDELNAENKKLKAELEKMKTFNNNYELYLKKMELADEAIAKYTQLQKELSEEIHKCKELYREMFKTHTDARTELVEFMDNIKNEKK